jgi:hypothetical protein
MQNLTNNSKTFHEAIKLMEELFGIPFYKITPNTGNTLKLVFCWHKIESPKCNMLFTDWLELMDSEQKQDELNRLCSRIMDEFKKL